MALPVPSIAEPGSTKPSAGAASGGGPPGRFSSASRTMVDNGLGRPSGSRATAPKSRTKQAPIREQLEVARMRVGVQQAQPRRRGVMQLGEQRRGMVALSGLRARADDVQQFAVTHSVTIALGADATTFGTRTLGSPSNAAANIRWFSASSR